MTDWERAKQEWPGLVVLIGLTHLHRDGSLDRREQFYGQIVSVDPVDGIELDLSGQDAGERYWLPPDLRAFERAPPGDYTLTSSGQVVRDPDLLTQWTVESPLVG